MHRILKKSERVVHVLYTTEKDWQTRGERTFLSAHQGGKKHERSWLHNDHYSSLIFPFVPFRNTPALRCLAIAVAIANAIPSSLARSELVRGTTRGLPICPLPVHWSNPNSQGTTSTHEPYSHNSKGWSHIHLNSEQNPNSLFHSHSTHPSQPTSHRANWLLTCSFRPTSDLAEKEYPSYFFAQRVGRVGVRDTGFSSLSWYLCLCPVQLTNITAGTWFG